MADTRINHRNIVLTGFMGCGKTTVGKELAHRLEYGFVDTDHLIESFMSMSVSQIFEKHGEPEFRRIEQMMVSQVSAMQKTVVATGGGVVKDPSNMRNLKQNGIIVYLRSTPEKIYENTCNNDQRPLLATGNRLETIRSLMAGREPLYMENCHFFIDTAAFTPEETVSQICAAIQKTEVTP